MIVFSHKLWGKTCLKINKITIYQHLMRETTKAVKKIQGMLETLHSWQKSYADKRMRPLEFQVGDKVFLQVAPFKEVVGFDKR